MITEFEEGFLLGILTGEGHFGGDGKQPQITLRMHTRHEKLFHWLVEKFPDSKLYGPYNHSGRSYYQWMARGQVLKNQILPVILKHIQELDTHTQERINQMIEKYRIT